MNKHVPNAHPPPWRLVVRGDKEALKSSLRIILGWFNEKSISWSIVPGELEIKSTLQDPVIINAILNELRNQATNEGQRIFVTVQSELKEEKNENGVSER